MHASVMGWVAAKVDEHGLASRNVLEVGSMNVNGSIRMFFTGTYLGVDMASGPGVDRLADAERLPFSDDMFHVVVSTEMLEHCRRPWLAVAEMVRVAEPAGMILATARGFDKRGCWPVHGYPHDHWRLGEGAIATLLDDAGADVIEVVCDSEGPGWFAAAVKR